MAEGAGIANPQISFPRNIALLTLVKFNTWFFHFLESSNLELGFMGPPKNTGDAFKHLSSGTVRTVEFEWNGQKLSCYAYIFYSEEPGGAVVVVSSCSDIGTGLQYGYDDVVEGLFQPKDSNLIPCIRDGECEVMFGKQGIFAK